MRALFSGLVVIGMTMPVSASLAAAPESQECLKSVPKSERVAFEPPVVASRKSPKFRHVHRKTPHARVVLKFSVAPDGRVEHAKVVESVPDSKGAWDETALEAISGWTYRPAMNAGKAVTCDSVILTMEFDLFADTAALR